MRKPKTAERLDIVDIDSAHENSSMYLRHLAIYKFCLKYTSGKRVLDYGCGIGYGAALVSQNCKEIIGLDISEEAIGIAKDAYKQSNLTFQLVEKAEDSPLPFSDQSFDVVLSLHVIEHVANVEAYLKEISRVLAPDGCAIFATPNRSNRLFPLQKPWNMWHLREYSKEQLHDTLKPYFGNIRLFEIGGKKGIVEAEARRVKVARFISLPATLPIIPDFLRIRILKLLNKLRRLLPIKTREKAVPEVGENAFRISKHESYAIDLLALTSNQ